MSDFHIVCGEALGFQCGGVGGRGAEAKVDAEAGGGRVDDDIFLAAGVAGFGKFGDGESGGVGGDFAVLV